MFWKKPKFQSARFGELIFRDGKWNSNAIHTHVGDIGLSVAGSKAAPNVDALDAAGVLLEDIARLIAVAVESIRADRDAQDFVAGQGELVVDLLDVDAAVGDFSIAFGLSELPDAMVDVPFKGGVPYAVLLAD